MYQAPGPWARPDLSGYPDFCAMPMIGQTYIPAIYVQASPPTNNMLIGDMILFKSIIAGTPGTNFAATATGIVNVKSAGQYTICQTVTAGDFGVMFVDGKPGPAPLPDNYNIPGTNMNMGGGTAVTSCAAFPLAAGQHQVMTAFFHNAEFDGGLTVSWSGDPNAPDTSGEGYSQENGHDLFTSGLPGAPLFASGQPLPSNGFLMTVYDDGISTNLGNTVGQASIPTINIPYNPDPKSLTFGALAKPSDPFYASFMGQLVVKKQGAYSFCITSDDGSYLMVDMTAIVDNGGMAAYGGKAHVAGFTKQCGTKQLAAGQHVVYAYYTHTIGAVAFIRNSVVVQPTGTGMVVTWSGPDTIGATLPIGNTT